MVSFNFPVIAFIVIMIMQIINYMVSRFYSAKSESTKNSVMLGLFLSGLAITFIVMIYIIYFKLNKIDELARNIESLK
jgi:uncharacterized membrane protein